MADGGRHGRGDVGAQHGGELLAGGVFGDEVLDLGHGCVQAVVDGPDVRQGLFEGRVGDVAALGVQPTAEGALGGVVAAGQGGAVEDQGSASLKSL